MFNFLKKQKAIKVQALGHLPQLGTMFGELSDIEKVQKYTVEILNNSTAKINDFTINSNLKIYYKNSQIASCFPYLGGKSDFNINFNTIHCWNNSNDTEAVGLGQVEFGGSLNLYLTDYKENQDRYNNEKGFQAVKVAGLAYGVEPFNSQELDNSIKIAKDFVGYFPLPDGRLYEWQIIGKLVSLEDLDCFIVLELEMVKIDDVTKSMCIYIHKNFVDKELILGETYSVPCWLFCQLD
ncbi:MAG: hypothetical protein H7230_00805 [Candidatus Parcubacteria bacterium]|nr:hypothetical protein [Candidatus Paceibacterota bacterium]